MGADKKNNLLKCGEILINLATIDNKINKTYTYNCSFCNAKCNGVTKFSLHLGNYHMQTLKVAAEAKNCEEFSDECEDRNATNYLQEFTEKCKDKDVKNVFPDCVQESDDDDKPSVYLPEIKLEELETKRSLKRILSKSDPLGPTAKVTKYFKDASLDELSDTGGNEIIKSGECEDFKNETLSTDDNVGYHITADSPEPLPKRKRKKRLASRKNRRVMNIDVSSDDSKDEDFDFGKELSKSKPIPPVIKHGASLKQNKELSIVLLKAYEKQSYLWDGSSCKLDKSKLQKGFEIIAKEVYNYKSITSKLKKKFTFREAKRRINQMRFDYADELQKKYKGEPYEIPWFAEHMKYLEDNTNQLVRNRETLDETELKVIIELYKKYENLWQVNGIAFGIGRNEIYEQMREEFKQIRNIDITEEEFYQRVNYMLRLYSKDKHKHIKCELKKRKFKPSSAFYEEMSFLSESQGPFMCPNCNEIIEKYDAYLIHVAEHFNVMPFKCKQCEMCFNKYHLYIVHTQRHLNIYNFTCNLCGKGYMYKSQFDNHCSSHTGEKTRLCPICGASYRAHSHYCRKNVKLNIEL